MRIIATLPEGHGYMPGAIIQVTGSELSRIIGAEVYPGRDVIDRVTPGRNVEINKRFDHARHVIDAAQEAKKLPNALRAFADTLETIHPAIDDVTNPVIEASLGVSP